MDLPRLTKVLLVVPTVAFALAFVATQILAFHVSPRAAIAPLFWAFVAYGFLGFAGLVSAGSILRNNPNSRTRSNWQLVFVGVLPVVAIILAIVRSALFART